jgi:O-glycosyl hydrolase
MTVRALSGTWTICLAVFVACTKHPGSSSPRAGDSAQQAGRSGAAVPRSEDGGRDVTQPAQTSRPGGQGAAAIPGGAGTHGNAGMDGSAGRASAGSSAGASGSSAGSNASGPRPTITAASGTTLVKVNPGIRHQTFEGWGTSLCWWANHVGRWSASARNTVVDSVVDPVEGLGYNIFRYNIGGGENPAHTHMGQYKDLPGFESSAGVWTWDADANQRAILQRIVERDPGVILEAFSNSPPYWMTKSACASGNTDGSNNLKDDSYDAFADYLTEVVKHFRDSFGITFRTLEPLNEPNASWWKANGGQEGCHFSPSNQQLIIKAVGAKLAAKGLSDTSVSASDENSIDDGYNNLRGFDGSTLATMKQMNVHSYSGSHRSDLRALATSKGKRLWQSESGPLNQTLADDTDAAVFMAGRIISDLRDMQAEAWVDWQVGDPSRSWASFALNENQQTVSPLKRFYMHAGFSRYIRPGASFVEIDNAEMLAAVSADGGTLTLVALNSNKTTSKSFTFDLTALAALGAMAEVHRTSRTEDLVSLAAISLKDWSFVANAPAYSITTFVIPMR